MNFKNSIKICRISTSQSFFSKLGNLNLQTTIKFTTKILQTNSKTEILLRIHARSGGLYTAHVKACVITFLDAQSLFINMPNLSYISKDKITWGNISCIYNFFYDTFWEERSLTD
jgi:hypothetical protein